MNVKISQLLKVADLILNHVVICLKIDSIQIPDDHVAYYDVKSPARYNYVPGAAKPSPDVSNLGADWKVLQDFPDDPEGRLIDLVQLSNLLRAIGDNPGWVIGQRGHP